jgi:PTS system mannose-specific IIA component
MTGILLVTPGRLGEAMLAAVSQLVNRSQGLDAVSIRPDEDMENVRLRISQAVDALADPEGVLIFTDQFGGTPFNLAVSLMKDQAVEVVAGVNLPMLLRAVAGPGDLSLPEFARELRAVGRRGILDTSNDQQPTAVSVNLDGVQLRKLTVSVDQCIGDLEMLRSLLKALESQGAPSAGIGHNSMPAVDPETHAIVEEALLASSILSRELKLEAPQPDAVSLAHRLLRRLLGALKSFMGWAAKKGDKFVDGAIDSISKAAGTAVVIGVVASALHANVSEMLPQLAEILKKLLENLG